jgi:hypothetical protein
MLDKYDLLSPLPLSEEERDASVSDRLSLKDFDWIERQVEIAAIDLAASPVVRNPQINEDAVERYAALYRNEADCPWIQVDPIYLGDVDGILLVVTGRHRIEASRRVEHALIRARVALMSQDDVTALAVGSNISHGLPRTSADKREAARLSLLRWPLDSNRQHAARCGVHHDLIGDVREKIEAERGAGHLAESARYDQPVEKVGSPSETRRIVRRGGREYPIETRRIGVAQPKTKPDLEVEPDMQERRFTPADSEDVARKNREDAAKREARYIERAPKEVRRLLAVLSEDEKQALRQLLDAQPITVDTVLGQAKHMSDFNRARVVAEYWKEIDDPDEREKLRAKLFPFDHEVVV